MATYNSNVYAKSTQGKWGVYPVSVAGYVTIPNAADGKITSGDYLNLCGIPPLSMIVSFVLDIPQIDAGGPSAKLRLEDDGSSSSSGTLPAATSARGSSIIYVPDTVITTSVCGSGGIITSASMASGYLGTTYDAIHVLRLYATATAATGVTGAQLNFEVVFAPI